MSTADVVEKLTHAFGNTLRSSVKDMDSNTGWAFAANRQICGRAAFVPPKLHRIERHELPNGSVINKKTPVHVHPFLDLLRKPNTDETGLVFRWRQILHLQTSGRSYVAVFPEVLEARMGRNARLFTHISQMRLLEPDRMTIEAKDGRAAGVFIYSSPSGGNIPFRAAPSTRYEREQWKRDPYRFVFAINFPGTRGYDGQSPAEAGRLPAENLDALGKMHQGQLKNGIHAGLIFKLKGSNEDENRFRAMMNLLHAGLENSGSAIFLPSDRVEVDKSPSDNRKMMFTELARISRQEELGVIGASDSVVGMVDSSSRATIWGQEHFLAIGTVDPLNGLVSDAYNNWLLPLFPGLSDTSRMELSFESAKMVDEKDRAEVLGLYVEKGIKTPNEARAEIGKDPKPGGDQLLPLKQNPGPVTDLSSDSALENQDKEADSESRVDWSSIQLGPDPWTSEGRAHLADGLEVRTSAFVSALEEEVRATLTAAEREVGGKANRIALDEYRDIGIGEILDMAKLKDALAATHRAVMSPALMSAADDTLIDCGMPGKIDELASLDELSEYLDDNRFVDAICTEVGDGISGVLRSISEGTRLASSLLDGVSEVFEGTHGVRLIGDASREVRGVEAFGSQLGLRWAIDHGAESVRKMWVSHGGCHQAADGQVREVAEEFDVDDGSLGPSGCLCKSIAVTV